MLNSIKRVYSNIKNKIDNDDKENLNIKYNLPFRFFGDTDIGTDYHMTYIEYDRYELICIDNKFNVFSPSLHSNIHTVHIIDAQTAAKVTQGEHMPNLGLYRLTASEEKELQELREECRVHVKNKRINHFKKLPSHIRQSIVDESLLRDMIDSWNSNNYEADFEGINRLNELDAKQNNNFPYRGRSMPILGDGGTIQYKYSIILLQFTSEDLSKAHLEATLEEELDN